MSLWQQISDKEKLHIATVNGRNDKFRFDFLRQIQQLTDVIEQKRRNRDSLVSSFTFRQQICILCCASFNRKTKRWPCKICNQYVCRSCAATKNYTVCALCSSETTLQRLQCDHKRLFDSNAEGSYDWTKVCDFKVPEPQTLLFDERYWVFDERYWISRAVIEIRLLQMLEICTFSQEKPALITSEAGEVHYMSMYSILLTADEKLQSLAAELAALIKSIVCCTLAHLTKRAYADCWTIYEANLCTMHARIGQRIREIFTSQVQLQNENNVDEKSVPVEFEQQLATVYINALVTNILDSKDFVPVQEFDDEDADLFKTQTRALALDYEDRQTSRRQKRLLPIEEGVEGKLGKVADRRKRTMCRSPAFEKSDSDSVDSAVDMATIMTNSSFLNDDINDYDHHSINRQFSTQSEYQRLVSQQSSIGHEVICKSDSPTDNMKKEYADGGRNPISNKMRHRKSRRAADSESDASDSDSSTEAFAIAAALTTTPANQRPASRVPLSPPYFIVTPCDVACKTGERAQFYCHVGGSSPLCVTWLRNGCNIAECDRYRIVHQGNEHLLEIYDTESTDEGDISCHVQNGMSAISNTAYLAVREAEVTGHPPILIEPLVRKECVSKSGDGRRLILSCRFGGYPTPRVLFYQNDTLLFFDERLRAACDASDDENGLWTVTIDDAQKSDGGIYAAVAINRFGKTACELYVNV